MDETFELFLQAWDDSEKVIILTGAGVSTLSGIPDFRGSGGLYTKDGPGESPEELLKSGIPLSVDTPAPPKNTA